MVGFVLVIPVVLARPVGSPVWFAGALLVLAAVVATGSPLAPMGRTLLRLRWMFAALLVFHALLTPGDPIFPGTDIVSWQGLRQGLHQALRLILLAALAWALMRTTSLLQLVEAFRQLSRWLQKVGVDTERGWSILAFTLGRLPHLLATAHRIRQQMSLRLVSPSVARFRFPFNLVLAAQAFLVHLLREVHHQEQGLRARGFHQRLPLAPRIHTHLGWPDFFLLSCAGAVLLASVRW